MARRCRRSRRAFPMSPSSTAPASCTCRISARSRPNTMRAPSSPGAAGGHMSKSGKIGFIGGFPIPDIVGPANALLLGAQSVNPAATCNTIFLNSWFDPGKEKEAANALMSQGCDVICSMTDTATGVQVAGEKGAWSIGYASDMAKFGSGKHLTAFTLDWTSDYVSAGQGRRRRHLEARGALGWPGRRRGQDGALQRADPGRRAGQAEAARSRHRQRQGASLCRRVQGPGRQRQGRLPARCFQTPTSAA